jgi:outer membrane protein TolC
MVSARVGFEIPVWKGRKQDAEVRAAEHELRSMTEELRAETARMRSEATMMLMEVLVADRQARRFQEEIVPKARLTAEARRAAYATGRSDVNDMIEAVRMRLMAEADAARRQADRFGAWARWQAIAGPDPLPEGDSR